jgi:ABC-type maltose transport system permease subunit
MVGMMSLSGPYTVDGGGQAAVSLLGSLPTWLIFFQRTFIRELTPGTIKG